ncbi:hybrid signal transduction histidine kinase M-like [Ostrea edulis]|uniref:hybrid signal transduction histidine kinase M-like n=1 Tax=Ostrea edulis TaxID=37623 RepID=UPI0024AFEFEA|nr:hybrid signal transduction histidine kinase M-like [Ostrea edulis]
MANYCPSAHYSPDAIWGRDNLSRDDNSNNVFCHGDNFSKSSEFNNICNNIPDDSSTCINTKINTSCNVKTEFINVVSKQYDTTNNGDIIAEVSGNISRGVPCSTKSNSSLVLCHSSCWKTTITNTH